MEQIIEFASIATITLVIYLSISVLFTKLHPATKMLLAMFFGVIAYLIGKAVVLSLL